MSEEVFSLIFYFYQCFKRFGQRENSRLSQYPILFLLFALHEVCIVRASSRYKSMSEFLSCSSVHEWRFAFTIEPETCRSNGRLNIFMPERGRERTWKAFPIKSLNRLSCLQLQLLDLCFSKIHHRVNNTIYEFCSVGYLDIGRFFFQF